MICFFSKLFGYLRIGCEYRVCLAVRRPSVRSSQSEYSGKVGVTLLTVNVIVTCYHNRIRVTLLSIFCEYDNHEASLLVLL